MTMPQSGLHTHPDATTEDSGVIELATNAEVIGGLGAERAVTPVGLSAWADANPATEANRGLIELASDAEVIGGTDTERAVTPAGLEAWSVGKGSNQYALYRATISNAFPCLSGTTNITVPFTSLAVERGDSGGATLQSNMVVLNRPGLYLLRACVAFYNSVGVGRLQIRILDASGTEIGITMANSGNTDSTADLCPIVTDFRWCEAGTKILCEANYRGNASSSTVRSGYTNLAVTRIAD
ncbi:MAG: hypothetical protein K9H25_19070 [Rhodospirillum sp.]|nr:hypothetical protein [Rhodospirillum sp.]MCF8489625.1 hypothetical protein [Rhodospirillum sp.]MCF8499656.1 hypothetical protein [Rhodospirillum sp.]